MTAPGSFMDEFLAAKASEEPDLPSVGGAAARGTPGRFDRDTFLMDYQAARFAEEEGLDTTGMVDSYVNSIRPSQKTVEGTAGVGVRSLVALLGDTPEEKQAAFGMAFPEGEMWQVPGTDTFIVRESQDEDFRVLDQSFAASLAEGRVGKEIVADVVEGLSGEGLVIAGEAAGLLAGKKPGGGRFVRDTLRTAAGAFLGETTQQGAQSVAGTQRESAGEQFSRARNEAGLSVFGGTVGAGVSRGASLATGRSVNITPEGRAASLASERATRAGVPIPQPLPMQMIDSPILLRFGRQAGAILSTISTAIREQQELLNKGIRGMVDRPARTRIVDRSRAALNRATDGYKDLVLTSVRNRGALTRNLAGELKDLTDRWWKASGDTVNDLYGRARAIQEPEFDMEPALGAAARIKGGVRAATRPVAGTQDTGLVDELGAAITRETSEAGEMQLRELSPPLLREIEKLENIDLERAGTEGFASATDSLREIQRNLYDLSLPGPEGSRRDNLFARELRGAIEEVLDNPIGGGDEFRRTWRVAQNAAKKRFTTREEAAVVEMFNLSPSKFVEYGRGLTKPKSFGRLSSLHAAFGDEGLEKVRDIFRMDLGQDPYSITKTLGQYDPETLRMLIPNSSELEVLRHVGKGADRLRATRLPQALDRQTRTRAFVKQLVDNPSTLGSDALKILVKKEGRNSEFAKSLEAAILDEVWKRSNRIGKSGKLAGLRRLDSTRLNNTLEDFDERGLLQFVGIGKKRILRDIEQVQRVMDLSNADAGSELAAAQTISGLRRFSLNSLRTVVEQFGVSKLMVNERGRQVLALLSKNQDKKVFDTRGARLVGAWMASLASEAETNNRATSAERAVKMAERIQSLP